MYGKVNSERRTALKIIAGVAATGFIANTPSMAALVSSEYVPGAVLDCKLISRVDIVRAHLLMQNKSKIDVVVNTLQSQTINYDNTYLNLARAYTKPMTIPANGRIMVRLDIERALEPMTSKMNVVNMDVQFLPFGTRVVDMKLIIRNGVAEAAKYSVLT